MPSSSTSDTAIQLHLDTILEGGGSEGDGVGRLLSYPGVDANHIDPDGDNPAEAYVKSRGSEATRRFARVMLTAAAKLMGHRRYEDCPFHRWRRKELLNLCRKLSDKIRKDEYVPNTGRRILGCVLDVLEEAWRRGDIEDHEEYRRLVDGLPELRGDKSRRAVTVARKSDLIRLITQCQADHNARGARDAFLIALAAHVGLRSKELADLDLCDINRDANTLYIRAGKGTNDRTVYFNPHVLDYLDIYLRARGTEPGPLLVRTTNGGLIWPGLVRLSPSAIQNVVSTRSARLGRRITSHALRRYAATEATRATGNPALANKTLGHKSYETTVRLYVQFEDDELQRAASDIPIIATLIIPPSVSEAVADDEPPAPPVGARLLAVLEAMRATLGG